MTWKDQIKNLGINLHIIATGAGARFQDELWGIPGASSFLSGASFPYSAQEQEELLGFRPDKFACPETALNLACTAYMKAYQFNGKKPIGVGLTASVASQMEHRGEHRLDVALVANDKIWLSHQTLLKGSGEFRRSLDGETCNNAMFFILMNYLGLSEYAFEDGTPAKQYQDGTTLATELFFLRPFFAANGKRLLEIPANQAYFPYHPYALMSGAFNPPHQGHLGVAHQMWKEHSKTVIFEMTVNSPHKENLTIQQLLQRAKLLQGYNRVFTDQPLYLDKARSMAGMPLVVGADAMLRMLNPQWGIEPSSLLEEFNKLHTRLYIVGREINGKFMGRDAIEAGLPSELQPLFHYLTCGVNGRWDISSSQIRQSLDI